MNIVAHPFDARVALCGHWYEIRPGQSTRRRKQCDECKPAPIKKHAPPRKCAGCDSKVQSVPGMKPRKWCSEGCRVRAFESSNPAYVERKAKRAADKRKAAYAPKVTAKVCVQCGDSFEANMSNALYCSPPCRNRANHLAAQTRPERAVQRKANKDLRRASKMTDDAEQFERSEIYDRDGWVCQLCFEPVSPDALYPDHMSASLDHVVPLAKGGSHTRANAALAHWICNTTKSDKVFI